MFSANRILRQAAKCALALLILVTAPLPAQAQSRQLVTWLENLNYLQTASAAELNRHLADLQQVRAGIESWLKLHPGMIDRCAP